MSQLVDMQTGEILEELETGSVTAIESPNAQTIYQRLAALGALCAYIRKDGINQFHKYAYATAAQVFEKVGEGLSTVGLVSIPQFSIAEATTRTNAKGATESLVTVKCELQICDETGAALSTVAFGCGMDSGDKAPMKAQTAALKYAWMMLLNISTGDDPEGDHSVDTRMEGKPLPKEKPRGPKLTETANQAVIEPPSDDGDPGYDPEPPAILQKHKPEDTAGFTRALADYKAGLTPGVGELCACGSTVSAKTNKTGTFYGCDLNYKAVYRGDSAAQKELAEKNFTGKHTYRKEK